MVGINQKYHPNIFQFIIIICNKAISIPHRFWIQGICKIVTDELTCKRAEDKFVSTIGLTLLQNVNHNICFFSFLQNESLLCIFPFTKTLCVHLYSISTMCLVIILLSFLLYTFYAAFWRTFGQMMWMRGSLRSCVYKMSP